MLFADLILFAQGIFNQFNAPGDDVGGSICHSLHFLVYLGILVYVLIQNYNALNAVAPRNRDMEPAMVFLCLIPCFNLIWYFFIVSRVGSSLEKEFDDRGISGDGDFGRGVGTNAGVLACVCCTIGWMICAIIQAVKMHTYIQKLQARGRRRMRDDYDDDDDDRPRRRRDDDENDD